MAFKLEGAQDISQANKPFKLEGATDAPTSKSETSFTQRVGEDFKGRQEQRQGIKERTLSGDISPINAAIQTTGVGAGMVGDVTSEALKSAYSTLAPEPMKKRISSDLERADKYISGTDAGKAALTKAERLAKSWKELEKNHPDVTGDIKAFGNIASAVPALSVAKGAKNAIIASAPTMKTAGKSLVEAAEKEVATRKSKNIYDLVKPRETLKTKEQDVGRTKVIGKFGNKITEPTGLEKQMVETVGKVPGINPNKSSQYNYNVIDKENRLMAKSLKKQLQEANIPVSPVLTNKVFNNIANTLQADPLMVGSNAQTAKRTLLAAQEIVAKNEPTAAGLLQARKDFDKYVISKQKNIFKNPNDSAATAFKGATDIIRTNLNNALVEAAPSIDVRRSLDEQFHLSKTMENLKPKAAREASTGLGRYMQKGVSLGESLVPTSNPLVRHGLGLGGLGISAAVGVPHAAIKGAKAIWPTAQKALGRGMTRMGDILSPSKSKPLKLLPKPTNDIMVVDRQNVARPITNAERQSADIARKKATETGLTPDVRRTQIRNEVNKAYEQRDLARNAVKEGQIAKIAEQSSVPIDQLVEMSDQNIKELANILGKKHSDTAFAQALRKALKDKASSTQ